MIDMATSAHKEILGDVRFLLTTQLRDRYVEKDGMRGFSHTTQGYFVKALYGIDANGLEADYYIAPGDGGGPIIVEVGNMDDAKWEELASTDGKPVRVLRVGFDRSISLLHPRHTEFEGDLLNVLSQGLVPA